MEMIQQATNQSQAANVDHNHPLYLSPFYVSGIQIISFQPTSIGNFFIWFRSLGIAFLGRNKLGLVDGSWDKNFCISICGITEKESMQLFYLGCWTL